MAAKLGSQYCFVIEPDAELKCAICLCVAKDPLQHQECGKLFCKECIEKHGEDEPCPHCKMQSSQYHQDHNSEYIQTCRYLKDGTLYISVEVEVEVTDHKPWLECSI